MYDMTVPQRRPNIDLKSQGQNNDTSVAHENLMLRVAVPQKIGDNRLNLLHHNT